MGDGPLHCSLGTNRADPRNSAVEADLKPIERMALAEVEAELARSESGEVADARTMVASTP